MSLILPRSIRELLTERPIHRNTLVLIEPRSHGVVEGVGLVLGALRPTTEVLAGILGDDQWLAECSVPVVLVRNVNCARYRNTGGSNLPHRS